jgi:hypothetical protein
MANGVAECVYNLAFGISLATIAFVVAFVAGRRAKRPR